MWKFLPVRQQKSHPGGNPLASGCIQLLSAPLKAEENEDSEYSTHLFLDTMWCTYLRNWWEKIQNKYYNSKIVNFI